MTDHRNVKISFGYGKRLIICLLLFIIPFLMGPIVLSFDRVIEFDHLISWFDNNSLWMLFFRISIYLLLALVITLSNKRICMGGFLVKGTHLICAFLIFDLVFILRVMQYIG